MSRGRGVLTAPAVKRPRVWLVAGLSTPDGVDSVPVDRPVVRDDLMRCWEPGEGGWWHTVDGRHHATWTDLRTRYDLVEVRA